jgi:hypothetical protein
MFMLARMHHRALLSLTLLATAGTAMAADGGSWDYWVRAQASAGSLGLSGDASFTDKGLGGTTFSTADVGLDDSALAPAVEIGLTTPILDFHAFLGWQSWSVDGDATLDQQIDFAGESFTAGTAVSSKAEITDIYAEFNWAPISLNLAGFSLGLAAHQLAVSTEMEAAGQNAKFDETFIIPTLAVRAYVAPLDSLEFEVMVHGLAVPLGDVSGSYLVAQAQVAYYPLKYIGVIGGWRTTMIDIEYEADQTKAKADVSLSGPYLGVAAQF